ncbi:hypothetical protein D2E26_1056 [Bifidobacterium dolichotidis]|uniref:Uncharacterized protein n=1 Tax=Bifidobacterium dolichotidis TaxID=2306976 RepID=A0A430FQ73_9BIFI|nr:hypothetical protein [Bifidobacterium dolichotidis]RSX55002.1 hypothetical protein D2E26_1056 [Bifidobacterium dolichotidis]
MDYESQSLSAIIVLVIVGIVMMIWLPRRTEKGMKQVIKHREDKYSSSLHLVDAHSGTTFSDEHTPVSKGAIMPNTQAAPGRDRAQEREYIARVRAARKAAIRRRRYIVATLSVLTVLVFLLSVVFAFSWLYTLIPAGLLVVVLGLGARASKQAREWEHRQKERNEAVIQAAAQLQQRHDARIARQRARQLQEAEGSAQSEAQEEPTDVLDQRQIRSALHHSRLQQAHEVAAREASAEAQAHEQEALRAEQEQHTAQADPVAEAAHANYVANHMPATDMVKAAAQRPEPELISFSLDASEPSTETAAEPVVESLEIKSTRQVAQAKPLPKTQQEQAPVQQAPVQVIDAESVSTPAQPAKPTQPAQPVQTPAADENDELQALDHIAIQVDLERDPTTQVQPLAPVRRPRSAADRHAKVNDSRAFHSSETHRDVEAPDESTDSLGSDLDSVLARRLG